MDTTIRGHRVVVTLLAGVVALAAAAIPAGFALNRFVESRPGAGVVLQTTAPTEPRTVAVVQDGEQVHLAVLDDTGTVIHRIPGVATDPADIRDASAAPDGTVAVVKKVRDHEYEDYEGALLVYDTDGQKRQLADYATSVAFSTDGARLGYALMSPDGDGDGEGRMAIRTVPAAGGAPVTIWDLTYPVDPVQGYPLVESLLNVRGWTGDTLVAFVGCCMEETTALLAPDQPVTDLGAVEGAAVGIAQDRSLLLRRQVWTGAGTEADPERLDALTYVKLTPDGQVSDLRRVEADDDTDWDTTDDTVARELGYRTFLLLTPARYDGPGQVSAAFR